MCVGYVWRSQNVRASRSGSLASVAFSHVFLACAQGVARVHLWISGSEYPYPAKSLSRSCIRPDCYGRSAGFAHVAVEAFSCDLSSEKEEAGGRRRLVSIHGRDGGDGAATAHRLS